MVSIRASSTGARRGGRAASAAVTAAVALGLAGCGGSAAASSASGSSGASRPTQLYTVALSGHAEPHAGAPLGSGIAIIAFHGSKTLCWRFAHLHGFTTATHAAIYSGAAGKNGRLALSLTGPPLLHHRGCVATTAATHTMIVGAPSSFYVNVFAARFPHGAVRGQL